MRPPVSNLSDSEDTSILPSGSDACTRNGWIGRHRDICRVPSVCNKTFAWGVTSTFGSSCSPDDSRWLRTLDVLRHVVPLGSIPGISDIGCLCDSSLGAPASASPAAFVLIPCSPVNVGRVPGGVTSSACGVRYALPFELASTGMVAY